ncbi:hypothetical protein BBF96_04295 [Anoxybacter fermentans]|uniref:FdrA domain protein n=1 Tax=Anoxybacter fermentans TaxID=1323375 RepID=A0A3Q9HPP4_9FIRM|nr:fdrA domain protein [Anoxybacter fermentans]AZR72677.1 hypothetical protein BBF96_04295 [Anoxybacter fermentans]
MAKNKIVDLFGKELKVINMGLESFANDLKSLNVAVIQMDWRPPAGGNKKMASLLAMLKD